MASCSRLTLYSTSLKQLSRRFSTHNSVKPASATFIDVTADKDTGASLRALNFPLPGNVTTDVHYFQSKAAPINQGNKITQTDLMSSPLMHEEQCDALRQFGQMAGNEPILPSQELEMVAMEAPKLVRRDFADLFPNRDISKGSFTMLSLTQKTEHDMSAWTQDMEVERETLTVQFIESASSICSALKAQGYWADFIDPSSGRPYLGPFTNATLFETDDRMRNFGLAVEDLGCCKVIKHMQWGTNVFVGNLFTNAPLDSPLMQDIVKTINN